MLLVRFNYSILFLLILSQFAILQPAAAEEIDLRCDKVTVCELINGARVCEEKLANCVEYSETFIDRLNEAAGQEIAHECGIHMGNGLDEILGRPCFDHSAVVVEVNDPDSIYREFCLYEPQTNDIITCWRATSLYCGVPTYVIDDAAEYYGQIPNCPLTPTNADQIGVKIIISR